jgi:Prolyl oligopeptidase family
MLKAKYVFVILILLSFSYHDYCQSSTPVVLKDGLIIRLGRPDYNSVISPDPVSASMVTGEWKTPSENKEFKWNDTAVGTWQKINPDSSGWIKDRSLRNSYIDYKFKSDNDDFAILEQNGNSMVFINGVEHSGNPYGYTDTYGLWEPKFNYSLIPIKLHKGENEFLFRCNRGYFKATLHPGKKGVMFNDRDITIPDLIVNRAMNSYGAIPVINATDNFYNNLMLKTWSKNSEPAYQQVSVINPLSIFKAAFLIKIPAQADTGHLDLNVALVSKENGKENVLTSLVIPLRIVYEEDNRRETYISDLDNSVQYYAINPPKDLKGKPALFLSLHGAGVIALNQANAYYHKNWGYIVCPTNRRPYGYDWENWGRVNALEVLNIAKKKFDVDPDRIYLTGHSMGGHGTWHVGINYADQFAAIGPSAGWISFWSYRINHLKDSSTVERMLVRSTKPSDTYAFTTNLKPDGIYIIHGEDDDNVPVEQSKSIVENLSKFHKDFIFHEQPKVGHWWDLSDEPGADCVDWHPLFDFFAHHAVAQKNEVLDIDFITSNPAVTSKNYWIQIINQDEQQKLSNIKVHLKPGLREFSGTTSNIKMFSIDASMLPPGKPVSVEVDSQKISDVNIPSNSKIYLLKNNGKWELTQEPNLDNKTPERYGNFREAFNHNVLFVYGTHGNKGENEWAFDKSRYDAEKIWYQGNGAIQVIKDDDFTLEKYKDRSVILFGNSETNSAWKLLLKDSPVQVSDDEIKVGDKKYKGDDLACLMIRPRPDSKIANVGIISGTGTKGMELVNFAQYFDQYMNLPDIVIYDSGILKSDDQGVKFTGYFGNDWSLKNGEFINQ